MAKKSKKKTSELVGFLGVGLDTNDEHKRVTRAENFVLVGGSSATHEHMQDTAIRFNEALDKKGKTLQEASVREVLDMLVRAMDD